MFLRGDDTSRNAVEDAQCNLEQIGDEGLVADVLLCVGQYRWYNREGAEARESLAKAQQIYFQLDKPMGVAHCNYWISHTYNSEDNYGEARRPAEAAALEYKRLDHCDSAAEALLNLGQILKVTGYYDEAFRQVWKGLCIYQSISGPSGIAQAWETLGQIHTKMGQYDDAHSAYEKSLKTFRTIPGKQMKIWQHGIALCLYGIAETYHYQERFEDEERIHKEYEELGIDISDDRTWD